MVYAESMKTMLCYCCMFTRHPYITTGLDKSQTPDSRQEDYVFSLLIFPSQLPCRQAGSVGWWYISNQCFFFTPLIQQPGNEKLYFLLTFAKETIHLICLNIAFVKGFIFFSASWCCVTHYTFSSSSPCCTQAKNQVLAVGNYYFSIHIG